MWKDGYMLQIGKITSFINWIDNHFLSILLIALVTMGFSAGVASAEDYQILYGNIISEANALIASFRNGNLEIPENDYTNLEKKISDLLAMPDVPEDVKKLTRDIHLKILTVKGCSAYMTGNMENAAAIFLGILKIKPDYNLDGRIAPQEPALFFAEKIADQYTRQVSFLSQPEGSDIIINGELRGKTPSQSITVLKGVFNLKIRHRGYKDLDIMVDTEALDPLVINTPLEKNTGSVRVFTKPGGVDIYLDGEYMGTTPEDDEASAPTDPELIGPVAHKVDYLLVDYIPLGKHRLEYRKQCYGTQIKILNMQEVFPFDLVPVEMIKGFGRIKVDSPKSSPVFLDGKPIGKTPLNVDNVCAGNHLLRVDLGNKDNWFQSFCIAPQENQTFNAHVRPTLDFIGVAGAISEKKQSVAQSLIDQLKKIDGFNFITPSGKNGTNESIQNLLHRIETAFQKNRQHTNWQSFITTIRKIASENSASLIAFALFPDQESGQLVIFAPELPKPDIYPIGNIEKIILSADFKTRYSKRIRVDQPYLGLTLVDYMDQVLVVHVSDNSPAREAGIRAGDYITKLNNNKVTDVAQWTNFLDSALGEVQRIVIERNGTEKTVTVPVKKVPVMLHLSDPFLSYHYALAYLDQLEFQPELKNSVLLNRGICFLSSGFPAIALEKGFLPCELPESSGVSWGTVLFFKALSEWRLNHPKTAKQDFMAAAAEQNRSATFIDSSGPLVHALAQSMIASNE